MTILPRNVPFNHSRFDQDDTMLKRQLENLSEEELDALEQEMIRKRNGIIASGVSNTLLAGAEGVLLASQGKSLSEGVVNKAPSGDSYEELLKREMLKNQVDPSRRAAQRKEDVINRKLSEQESGISQEIGKTQEQLQPDDSLQENGQLSNKKRPPKRIPIGEDENGLVIFGDNPDYKQALEIEKEERSIDLVAKKASEKDRQLNIGKISRLTNLVDLVEAEYAKTKTPGGIFGILRRPVETFSRGIQATENQRQDKAYGDFVKGIRVQIARAMSEVGNLSEPEQKAAMDLVPSLLDDPRTAEIKLKQLRDLVAKVQAGADEQSDPLGIR